MIDDDTIAQAQADEHDEPAMCEACRQIPIEINELCGPCWFSAYEADRFAQAAIDAHAELLNELAA